MIAPPPLIYLGGLGLGFGVEIGAGGGPFPLQVGRPIGIVSTIGGAVLLGSFVWAFRRADTPVDPHAPSTAVVTTGPYRLTRNPGYLGMALIYAGIAFSADAPWVLLPLPIVLVIIDRGVIAREECYLERRFGTSYLAYKRRVRRWL